MRNIYAKLTRSAGKRASSPVKRGTALLTLTGSWGLVASQVALADIVPKANGTATEVTAEQPSGNTLNITGGQHSSDESNLFHSFEQFNLDSGQTANFTTTSDLQNVLSYVTGDASNIDGLLQVVGSEANLYLINPAGILFGPSAQLNLPGNFTATTATAIGFEDQWLNLASDINGTIDYDAFAGNVTGFDFATAGAVVNLGDLTLGSDQTLSLFGGTVINTGSLSAPGGGITLTAVEEGQLVRLSQGTHLLSLEVSPAEAARWGEVTSVGELLTGGDRPITDTLHVDKAGIVRLANSGTQIPENNGNTVVSGTLSTASDTRAGREINLFGRQVALIGSRLDASGRLGGGTLRIGGDYQGSLLAPAARRTYISDDSVLMTDALASGNGGQAYIWSNEHTQFYGSLSSRGGRFAGDGGFVEISGERSLNYDGTVDLHAPEGIAGTILFDPYNITIRKGAGDTSPATDMLPNLLSTEANSDISFDIYEETLEQFSSVILEATNDIVIKNLSDNALTFQPGGNVVFRANSDGIGEGNFKMHVSNGASSDAIVAPGGRVTIEGIEIEVGEIDTAMVDGTGGDISLVSRERVSASRLNSGSANIEITGDEIDFTGKAAKVSAGTLTLQPSSVGADISINANGDDSNRLDISTDNLSALDEQSINQLILGREDGTGTVDLSLLPEDFSIPIAVRPDQISSTPPEPESPEPPVSSPEVPEISDPPVTLAPELPKSPDLPVVPPVVPTEKKPETEVPIIPNTDNLRNLEPVVPAISELPLLDIALAQIPADEAGAANEESSDRDRSTGISGVVLGGSDTLRSAEVFSQIETSVSAQFEDQLSLAKEDEQNEPVTLTQVQDTLNQVRQTTGVRSGLVYAYFVPDAASNDSVLASSDRTPHPEDQLEIMLISAGSDPVRKRQWGVTRADVEAAATTFRYQATSQFSRPSQYLPSAQQLYRWLIAPIETSLTEENINNLAMIMDEGLRTLPLAALHDGNQFLVEKYSIGLMPTFSLTNFGANDIARNQTARNQTEGASRFASQSADPKGRQQVLAMGASQFKNQPPLPAVAAELSFISDNLWLGSTFLNETFTFDNLKSQVASQRYNIVHLATHAIFEVGDPQESYIQLWDRRLGLLQLKELGFSESSIDLIILSACSTAMGDRNSEYGFAGFAVNAGSQSAMASLWPVSDEGTLGFMTQFYKHLTQVPIRSEALREAQIALIKGDVGIRNGTIYGADNETLTFISELEQSGSWDFSHPFYWSAFTMIGNPW